MSQQLEMAEEETEISQLACGSFWCLFYSSLFGDSFRQTLTAG